MGSGRVGDGADVGGRSTGEVQPVSGTPDRKRAQPAGEPRPDGTSPIRRVRVRVLGTPVIEAVPAGQHVRPQALEFLTYLVVRGGSAYQDELFDDLMPEPPRRLAAQRLHTYTYNLRQTFTMIGGVRPYVLLRRHRYTLAEDAFDVDLWSLRDAITQAATRDGPARTVALRRVVDLYRGPLAQDTSYLWVDAYRQAVRRDYVNAAVALANELKGRPERAAKVLEAAGRHHPDDEVLAAAVAHIGISV